MPTNNRPIRPNKYYLQWQCTLDAIQIGQDLSDQINSLQRSVANLRVELEKKKEEIIRILSTNLESLLRVHSVLMDEGKKTHETQDLNMYNITNVKLKSGCWQCKGFVKNCDNFGQKIEILNGKPLDYHAGSAPLRQGERR